MTKRDYSGGEGSGQGKGSTERNKTHHGLLLLPHSQTDLVWGQGGGQAIEPFRFLEPMGKALQLNGGVCLGVGLPLRTPGSSSALLL